MSAPVPDQNRQTRLIRLALLASAAVALFGAGLAVLVGQSPWANVHTVVANNIFYVIFARNEPLGCGVFFGGVVLLCVLIGTSPRWLSPRVAPALSRWIIPLAVVFSVAVAAAGTFFVCHNFALSMDEHAADFQAGIFMRGRILAPIPQEWWGAEKQISPTFIEPDLVRHRWAANYLPVYAAMRAVFHLVRAPWLLNPLMAGLSVLAVSAVARRVWPERPGLAALAALLLASSPQFLITAMTAYSMPAHLALNLAWLWLFARGDRTGMAIAPWLGLFAVGLHQPHVHLLFAFPFCARLVWERRWGWAAYYAAVYVGALAVWSAWYAFAAATALKHAALFAVPEMRQGSLQAMNLVLLLSWQNIATGVLLALALARWKRLPVLVRDAAWSCALTLGFHVFFDATQGHGWGERYFHPVLGCWVLIASAGWEPLCEAIGPARARGFALAAAVIALLACLPVRAFQVESFIRPFAKADEALRHVEADVIVIRPELVWYGNDLVRNDPFLENRPLRASAAKLGRDAALVLGRHARVTTLRRADLTRWGLIPCDSADEP